MWTDEFKTALRATHYHPKFRLLLGTRSVLGAPLGDWEEPSGDTPNVLEITSHTDPRTEWPDADFKSVIGLVTFTMGARSVSVRTLEPQLAALRVTVTNEAASHAYYYKPGTMCRLACDMNGSGYNTIFIGMYKGMQWDGGATTDLMFSEVLDCLRCRTTERKTTSFSGEISDHYSWFQGVGRQYTTAQPFASPGTTIELTAGTGTAGASDVSTRSALPNVYRHPEAWTPREADRIYKIAPEGGDGGLFCHITPTSGDASVCEYHSVGVSADEATIQGCVGDDRHYGFDDPFDSTNGTGSKVKPVLALYGSPVSELVNLFYIQGYHATMGSGIFGNRFDGMSSRYIDWDDLRFKSFAWRQIYEAHCTTGGTTPQNAPFRHLVTSAQRDGFSYLNKLFAKMGVFPTWRQGGYTAGIILDQGSMKNNGFWRVEVPENRIISASFSSQDPGAKGTYAHLSFKNTDKWKGSGGTGYTTPSGSMSTRSAPILPNLEVNTSDVASFEQWADPYGSFFRQAIMSPWYSGAPPARATVVLAGLRWANLALGDLISFDIPDNYTHIERGWQHRFKGPMKPAGTAWRHVLDGRAGMPTGTELPSTTWVVVSSAPNWIGGTVTLELVQQRP